MNIFINNFKKHWFKTTSIFLSISCVVLLCLSLNVLSKIGEKTMLEADILTMNQLNPTIEEEYFEYQITTLYNFYKELGYDLNNHELFKTRQQFLETIQHTTQKLKIYNDFLVKNNVSSKSMELLKNDLKNAKTSEEVYESYTVYLDNLTKECMLYILNNNLIDIEKEKQLLIEQYPNTNDNFINKILSDTISKKTFEIIVKTVSDDI